MNLKTVTLFIWGFLIASAAVAGEKHETRIEIKTDDSEHGVFEWHSNDPDADFSNLEVGESKTLEGKDGKEVVVTRTEDGFEFDIEGKKIQMPQVGDHGDMHVDVEVMHDGNGEVIVNKSKEVKIIRTDASDGVTVISSSELDDDTRAKIEAALKDSGNEGEVMFLDGSELHEDAQAHGEHEVRIIKKVIEETED